VVALLGPNGAGKTTTIEILEGFRGRSAGDVTVLGADPEHGGERWRARLGVVLQAWRDHAKWRPRELLHHLGAYYAGYATAEIPRPWDTDELLELVGLTAQARTRIGNLSGGQRRRLDVVIGIVGRPELLFLDEPTAGFDPAALHDCGSASALSHTRWPASMELSPRGAWLALCGNVRTNTDRRRESAPRGKQNWEYR
jgi:ABC-2 type transport system ATP-binding protein